MTRNENLNLEIGWASKVPDNHCHKSSRHINLWLEEGLQTANPQRQRLRQKRGATGQVAKDGSLLSGLSLELQGLGVGYSEVMVRTTTTIVIIMKIHGGFHLHNEGPRGQCQTLLLSWSKRILATSSQITLIYPVQDSLSWEEEGEKTMKKGEKTMYPWCLFLQDLKVKSLGYHFLLTQSLWNNPDNDLKRSRLFSLSAPPLLFLLF